MKRGDVFEVLDPPPGGLARLGARLDQRASRARRATFVAVPLAFALAALLVFVLGRPRAPDLVAAARANAGIDPSRLGLADPPPRIAIVDSQTTGMVSVPTTDPNVVFVWVGTTQ
jgi:hypothetical protein